MKYLKFFESSFNEEQLDLNKIDWELTYSELQPILSAEVNRINHKIHKIHYNTRLNDDGFKEERIVNGRKIKFFKKDVIYLLIDFIQKTENIFDYIHDIIIVNINDFYDDAVLTVKTINDVDKDLRFVIHFDDGDLEKISTITNIINKGLKMIKAKNVSRLIITDQDPVYDPVTWETLNNKKREFKIEFDIPINTDII